MTAYELCNPSDPYTFLAPDDELATLVCVLIGEGRTPWRRASDVPDAAPLTGPMDLWGRASHDRWFGRADWPDLLGARRDEVAAALASVLIGTDADRAAYEQETADLAGDDLAAFAARWHDERRSSLNDFGRYARSLAADLLGQDARRTP